VKSASSKTYPNNMDEILHAEFGLESRTVQKNCQFWSELGHSRAKTLLFHPHPMIIQRETLQYLALGLHLQ
jgi:hypothetical protein